MLESLFAALGSVFASGPALLLLAVLAALIPLLWDWRVALGVLVALHIMVTLMLAYLHGTPALLTVSQLVASIVAAGLLALAQGLRRGELAPRQPAGWLVRTLAMAFVVLAWWFIDPGIGLPMMSQPEVDFLIWLAICAILVTTFTADPLFTSVALLLWLLPAYAISIVLLPTTGMPALLGIAEILIALAGSYLILTQPRPASAGNVRRIVAPLPQMRVTRPLRMPALRPLRSLPAVQQEPAMQPAAASRSAAPDPAPPPAAQPAAGGELR